MLVKDSFWQGRRVLVTGHTGFKGGWLSLWLHQLGAEVTGFSLPAPTDPSFFEQTRLAEIVDHVEGDIRDLSSLTEAVRAAEPEIVLHLAAQALVRRSYLEPVETYATNVMGTVHLLEACRQVPSVRAIVCVTTDKCYENREWVWPYRESDPMGGRDPYSSSKGAAEIAISAYRRSFFQEGASVASARAGNVIGGGDWAEDRLIPDIIRSKLAGERPIIRSPDSLRPWQHVMDALSGYLLLAERLVEGDDEYATAWNFGPSEDDARSVGWIADRMVGSTGDANWDQRSEPQLHEATLLRLDASKARALLGWRSRLTLEDALAKVVDWHTRVEKGGDAREITLQQLTEFGSPAATMTGQVSWA